MSNQDFVYGTYQNLRSNTYSRTGYSFLGWSTDPNAQSATYTNGQSVGNLTTIRNDIVTLYAVWDANDYTLTFDANGGSVNPSTITVTYDSTYGANNNGVLPTPTRAGYLFQGWTTTSSIALVEGERFADDIYNIAGDSTLYARWYDTWYNHIETPQGAGTITNPYKISKAEHLGWLSYQVANGNELNAYCEQTANINLIEEAVNPSSSIIEMLWYPIGNQTHAFSGSYDGQGYKIDYLLNGEIDDQAQYQEYLGLFGNCSGASLKNIYVFATSISGLSYSGALVGYATNTTISNCVVGCGEFTTTNASTRGAIVGYGTSSVIIEECAVFSASTPTGDLKLSGGLANIQNCVYVLDDQKGYTGTDFSNFTYIEGMRMPLPKGVSWLAQGGTAASLSTIQTWANS